LAVLGGAAVAAGWLLLPDPQPVQSDTRPVATAPAETAADEGGDVPTQPSAAALAGAHGTSVAASDARREPEQPAPDTGAVDAAAAGAPVLPAYGETPAIAHEAHPQAAAAYRALQSGSRDHALLSVLAEPTPYPAQGTPTERDAWFARAEPARAFRPAEPGEGVPRLEQLSPYAVTIPQGGSTELRVKTTPGGPVTWSSMDLGAFENQLPCITVQADAEGIARAIFTAPPGTLHETDIQAASPTASGTLRWVITVTPTQWVPVPADDAVTAQATDAETTAAADDSQP
jgi:hypothetical protein